MVTERTSHLPTSYLSNFRKKGKGEGTEALKLRDIIMKGGTARCLSMTRSKFRPVTFKDPRKASFCHTANLQPSEQLLNWPPSCRFLTCVNSRDLISQVC